MDDFVVLTLVLRSTPTAYERAAFERMLSGLRRWELSYRQRQWVEQVAARLGLIEGKRILASRASGAWDPASAGSFQSASRIR